MHGCSKSALVYGFNMGDQDYQFDYDYLTEVFPDISQYATETVKNYLYEAIYGIRCSLDRKTGTVLISDVSKQIVHNLYNKYIEYLKKTLSKKDFNKKKKEIDLGFHMAVSGDYETMQEYIVPDEDWIKEDDKEEDDESESEYEAVFPELTTTTKNYV